ncbi:MAG: 2-C-methyl-D-erythritol 4-phosphate cytidylyltransferase [Candidatus Dormibacteria bacterium]
MVLPAYGRSDRMGEEKLWARVSGRTVLQLTLAAVRAASVFDSVVVVASRDRWRDVTELARLEGLCGVNVVEGGERRQDSVRMGLAVCHDLDHVCVHDAARPLCPPRLFRDVLEAARHHGAATAAVGQVDTIKRVHDGVVLETPERSSLVAVQTPQAFETSLIIAAHDIAREEGFTADDDCTLVERIGHSVRIVAGEQRNFKVTRPLDLIILRHLVGRSRSHSGSRSRDRPR